MSEIIFSKYSFEECKKDFIAFRNENRDSKRNEAYFEWRFLKRPSGAQPVIVWAETAAGEKIGSLSIVPHQYLINNLSYPLAILGDISVSRQWRGKGVAKQMFNYLSGLDEVKKLKACVVLPNEEAARPLGKASWQKVSELERYVKILRSEDFLKRVLRGKTFSKIISTSLNTVLRLSVNEVFLGRVPRYKSGLVSEFDERFDGLWNSLNKENMFLGMRNREYLTWRYLLHPIDKYNIFILLHDEKLCGYIIFYTGESTCYVIDVLCLNENRYPDYLLYNFINHIKKNDVVSSINLRINRSDFSRLPLYKFGFIRRPDVQHFMVHVNSEFSGQHSLLNGRNWYLTAGDKDV